MFWIFLTVTALAVVLIKLGAASVMVSVLSIGLKAAAIVIALLVAFLIWKKVSKPKAQLSTLSDAVASK